MILYQSDGNARVQRNNGYAHDPKCTNLTKHFGGSVVACTCMAAPEMGSLIFSEAVTHEGNCRMNSDVYRNLLSAYLQKRIQSNWEELHHVAKL